MAQLKHPLLPTLFLFHVACGAPVEPAGTEGTSSASGTTTSAPTTGTTAEPAPTTTDAGTSTSDGSTTSTTGTATTAAVTTTGAPGCAEDLIICADGVARVCDGAGGFKSEEVCPIVCVGGLGCATCSPGEFACDGDDVLRCGEKGGLEVIETCDPLMDLVCDPRAGACVGACSPAALGLSYIGCDYYPTVLLQHDLVQDGENYFAVAIANTSDESAAVTVTRGDTLVTSVEVGPSSVKLIALPWVDALSRGQGPTALVEGGAYRVRSTRPVVVYQYNPLAADVSNDASLLFPTNTWTGRYLVAAWPSFYDDKFHHPGLYAVVASHDDTAVTLVPSATGSTVQAGAGVAADGTGVVVLDRGDVLQVMSAQGGDVTGTIVDADKPVQVFGGHKCTDLPFGVAACDHLEESMFPLETLAKEYVVVPPLRASGEQLPKGQIVRVIASQADTTLTFEPDQPVAKQLIHAGDFVELPISTETFVVKADKVILVSQYVVGQSGGFGQGDPSMFTPVTPAQWRKDYLVHAPASWVVNFADLIAVGDAQVQVDGVDVVGWSPIAGTEYAFAHVELSNKGSGDHRVTADDGVSVSVNGIQNSGSYWYPGGLNLNVIAQ